MITRDHRDLVIEMLAADVAQLEDERRALIDALADIASDMYCLHAVFLRALVRADDARRAARDAADRLHEALVNVQDERDRLRLELGRLRVFLIRQEVA